MNFQKKIDLYYGQAPVKGDTQQMQRDLDAHRLTEFCAIFAESDLPADVHNKTNDHMLKKFGNSSQFRKEHGDFYKPYLVDIKTGLATVGIIGANATNLKGSRFKVGGAFFGENIAKQILEEFEKLGYEIEKKYR